MAGESAGRNFQGSARLQKCLAWQGNQLDVIFKVALVI